MNVQAGQAQSQLDGDACARRCHSAEKYEDKKHGEKSPYEEGVGAGGERQFRAGRGRFRS